MIRVTPGKAMPPIGFSAPPETADHRVSIFLCLVLTAALCTVILWAEIARVVARWTAPAVVAVVHLNGKDQTRHVDANGNALAVR